MLKSEPLYLPGRHYINLGMLTGCGALMVPLLGAESINTGLACLGGVAALSSGLGVTLTQAIGGRLGALKKF